jgi:hypothetical protein
MAKKRKPAPAVTESEKLGLELARTYTKAVDRFRDANGLSLEDADETAGYLVAQHDAEYVRTLDSDSVSWTDLTGLAESGESWKMWQGMLEEAYEEEADGSAAVRAMEGPGSTPMERARFLALRQALLEEWQPRGGLERSLIDEYASAIFMMRFWEKQLAQVATVRAELREIDIRRLGKLRAQAETEALATNQAAEMVDRFHRIAMRTLRALRDLRRFSPAVNIKSAVQVNVGQRQVNIGSS